MKKFYVLEKRERVLLVNKRIVLITFTTKTNPKDLSVSYFCSKHRFLYSF